MLSVIVPAHNEQDYIGVCLQNILQSVFPEERSGPVQVVVVANGCRDKTAAKARILMPDFECRAWQLDVLELEEGGKPKALNAGDDAALYDKRIYIDADIRVTQELLAQLAEALDCHEPVYASGQLTVPPARSFFSRRYARFWVRLPFISKSVPGCGVYAVNRTARARWDMFPEIISDDGFVRYHFTPDEMRRVPGVYEWPITEGLASLVRVRRRQNEGMAEIERLYPHLPAKAAPTAPDTKEKLRLFIKDPLGFVIYSAVAVAVRLPVFRNRSGWDRGR